MAKAHDAYGPLTALDRAMDFPDTLALLLAVGFHAPAGFQ
jgi:hypothetical protein